MKYERIQCFNLKNSGADRHLLTESFTSFAIFTITSSQAINIYKNKIEADLCNPSDNLLNLHHLIKNEGTSSNHARMAELVDAQG